MQQLKRSYSLTDLGEQQYDQHRFTDVTEEEEGEIFSPLNIHLLSSTSLLSSSHIQSNSDMQSVRFQVMEVPFCGFDAFANNIDNKLLPFPAVQKTCLFCNCTSFENAAPF